MTAGFVHLDITVAASPGTRTLHASQGVVLGAERTSRGW